MNHVAIFGVPRSGTSWLGQLFNSSSHVAYRYQPIFAYSFEGTLGPNSTTDEIAEFYQKLLRSNDDFVCQKKNISGNLAPQFLKHSITHLVWKEVRYLNIIRKLLRYSDTKVIGIVRHPCGVIKSWMNAPREFDSKWDIQQEWRHAPQKNTGPQDFFGYERWLDASEIFLTMTKAFPDRCKIVQYESLVKNPQTKVSALFEFAGISLGSQTKSFINESTLMSSDDPYGVFKKKKNVSAWRDKLPTNIINEITSDGRFQRITERLDNVSV